MNIESLKKRAKSFAWRGGMMIAAVLVDFLLQSLGDLNLNASVTVVLGLLLGEVSKQLNQKGV